MEKDIAYRILEVQEAFRNDPEHAELWAEQEACNDRFLEALAQMSQEQRTAVEDYVGILIEIQLRTLIYAVS